jgi:hypothetical protein
MLLFYIIHKMFAENMLHTSPKTITRHQFRTVKLVALMSPNTEVRELLLFVGNLTMALGCPPLAQLAYHSRRSFVQLIQNLDE